MSGHLLSRVACWLRGGHTDALRFRAGVHGYECVSCCRWRRSPVFAEDAR